MRDDEKIAILSYVCGMYRGIIGDSQEYIIHTEALKKADFLIHRVIYGVIPEMENNHDS